MIDRWIYIVLHWCILCVYMNLLFHQIRDDMIYVSFQQPLVQKGSLESKYSTRGSDFQANNRTKQMRKTIT